MSESLGSHVKILLRLKSERLEASGVGILADPGVLDLWEGLKFMHFIMMKTSGFVI